MGSPILRAFHSMKNGGIRTTTDNGSAGWYENLRVGRGKGLGTGCQPFRIVSSRPARNDRIPGRLSQASPILDATSSFSKASDRGSKPQCQPCVHRGAEGTKNNEESFLLMPADDVLESGHFNDAQNGKR